MLHVRARVVLDVKISINSLDGTDVSLPDDEAAKKIAIGQIDLLAAPGVKTDVVEISMISVKKI